MPVLVVSGVTALIAAADDIHPYPKKPLRPNTMFIVFESKESSRWSSLVGIKLPKPQSPLLWVLVKSLQKGTALHYSLIVWCDVVNRS